MGTPVFPFAFPTNRKQRIALYSAIVVTAIAIINVGTLITPLFSGKGLSYWAIFEVVLIVGQILSIASAISMIMAGNVEFGSLRVVYPVMVTNVVRVLLRDSIGLSLGITTMVLISSIGFLVLPYRRVSSTMLMGYAAGAAIILIDNFASTFYMRQISDPSLIHATRNLAIFIFVVQAIVLITQSQQMGLAVRFTSLFAQFTLMTVFAVGYAAAFAFIYQFNNNIVGFAAITMASVVKWTTVVGAIITFLGAVFGFVFSRILTQPLYRLIEASKKLSSGDLQARAEIKTEDEVGDLATAFNSMADSLASLVGQLEARVDERTKAIEERSLETQVAVEVGRVVASVRDIQGLLERTTRLISDSFGFYHVGVFLLDETREYAVLKAANSEGGRGMLEHGHKLKVGQTGIVGYVTQYGQARIALDVGQDAVYFDNPYLPTTRSEMAIPLVAGEVVLGALDVQSEEPQAFDEQDIATLQIVADQLTIALENTRLLDETKNALESARIAYGNISREAWGKILNSQPRLSYLAAPTGAIHQVHTAPAADITRAMDSGKTSTSSDGQTIAIPIKIRDQAIGALRLRKQDTSSAWTAEEMALAAALAEQVSGALESARIYNESQQRAARESLVSDISARISAQPRVDTILRETVQELGRAIGNASITFQLLETPNGQEQTSGPDNEAERTGR